MATTFQNSATVRDQSSVIMSGATVDWSTTNSAIATVSNTGLITAVGIGSAVVVAKSGSVQQACLVTVTA